MNCFQALRSRRRDDAYRDMQCFVGQSLRESIGAADYRFERGVIGKRGNDRSSGGGVARDG